MWFLIIVYLISSWYFSWWPFNETDRAIENSQYNAYFYYPNDREEYLGQVDGLSACQSAAWAKARSLSMVDANWSYICCRITRSSSCESKHR